MALSDSELWKHVRKLEGKTVYTIKRRIPNRISNVTDNRVVIKDKSTKPSHAQITSLYHQVHKTGEVISRDAWRFTYAVTYAILVEAVPDEIEAVPGKDLGIRLRGR